MSEHQATSQSWRTLAWLTGVSTIIYLLIAILGPQYSLTVPSAQRPMLLVIGLYALLFVPYWLAIRFASRMSLAGANATRHMLIVILLSSALFRLILLPTPPFQEIDIYRYLWDGAVVANGENPYRYPPQTIVDALEPNAGLAGQGGSLGRLVTIANKEPALQEILAEIHYGYLPSPYPPVSQAMFALPAALTPAEWSVGSRLVLLKLVLTLFDLATLALVFLLLRLAGKPIGLAIAYGWCPLVMKEIAGSGHLDSIATFFAVAAVTVGWWAFAQQRFKAVPFVGSAVMLALGVGAKLFPVILAPLLAISFWRRYGWKPALAWSALFVVVTGLCLMPMLLPTTDDFATSITAADDNSLPPPPDAAQVGEIETDSTDGIAAFLNEWEMNDLAFMVLLENLRPQTNVHPAQRPWFVVTSDQGANSIVRLWQRLLKPFAGKIDSRQASFLLTRTLTGGLFALIALGLAWRAGHRDSSADDWLRAAFLTLAWFWLLAPTQNPWYWCWAVPLLPFARSRAWQAMAATCFLYYLRFWLTEHFPSPGLLGTPYNGIYFFYYMVPWLEFLPVLVGLAIESWYSRLAKANKIAL